MLVRLLSSIVAALLVTTNVFADQLSAPSASAPKVSDECGNSPCNWTLSYFDRAALLVYVKDPALYEVCRTDNIPSSSLAPGSVIGLVVDDLPLAGLIPAGTEGEIEHRPSLLPLQPKSCTIVTGKSIAIYRTDNKVDTTVSGTFSRLSAATYTNLYTAIPFQINADTGLQFEPNFASLLYKMPYSVFTILCRGAGVTNYSAANVTIIADQKIIEIPVPVASLLGPGVTPNPGTRTLMASNLLRENSCMHIEAQTLALSANGGRDESLAPAAQGSFQVALPTKP